MNFSGQGTAAVAEMSPFSRPMRPTSTISSGRRAAPPMEIAGDISRWQEPSYPLVGFDPVAFLTANKIAVSLGVTAIVGIIAYVAMNSKSRSPSPKFA